MHDLQNRSIHPFILKGELAEPTKLNWLKIVSGSYSTLNVLPL